MRLDGRERQLTRREATKLRDELASALTRRMEFFRTAGEHREDGSYVVSRRAANSAGHSKVFESAEALERLYERLPSEFTATDVEHTGLTGGRRHILVRHLAEHPAFDCELVSQQPLTARKVDSADTATDADTDADEATETASDQGTEEVIPAD